MTALFDPPNTFELPLSKGQDLYVCFRYMVLLVDGDGNAVLDSDGNNQYVEANYPDGATVQLVIDSEEPIVADAEISGSMATVLQDKAVVESVPRNRLWRAVITFADGLDVVMCNGRTGRYDGKG